MNLRRITEKFRAIEDYWPEVPLWIPAEGGGQVLEVATWSPCDFFCRSCGEQQVVYRGLGSKQEQQKCRACGETWVVE